MGLHYGTESTPQTDSESWHRKGRRQRGGQWSPTRFEIGAPHFMFGPPVAAYIQHCILKMWPPLLVFGPSFWFLAPPAAKSWRRAWAQKAAEKMLLKIMNDCAMCNFFEKSESSKYR